MTDAERQRQTDRQAVRQTGRQTETLLGDRDYKGEIKKSESTE